MEQKSIVPMDKKRSPLGLVVVNVYMGDCHVFGSRATYLPALLLALI